MTVSLRETLHRRSLAEGIVKNCDLRCARLGASRDGAMAAAKAVIAASLETICRIITTSLGQVKVRLRTMLACRGL